MDIDKTTYEDLSVFGHEEGFSIFHKLNFTRTRIGRSWLQEYFHHPFSELDRILETQKILALILKRHQQWPVSITNGTIMVMEKFYETPIDEIPDAASPTNAMAYKLFHSVDYSLVRYSLGHFADFIRGMQQLVQLLDHDPCPSLLQTELLKIVELLEHEEIQSLAKTKSGTKFSTPSNH